MRLIKLGSFLSCAAVSLSLFTVGCGSPDMLTEEDLASESWAAKTKTIEFTELDVNKSASPQGVTVIESSWEYLNFFNEYAPAEVDFTKNWVIHFSIGVKSTGGYKAKIKKIQTTKDGADKALVIYTKDVSPGPGCEVTLGFTNPQTTVVIAKPKNIDAIYEASSSSIKNCD